MELSISLTAVDRSLLMPDESEGGSAKFDSMPPVPRMDPAAHRLLIASPSLTDPELFRTVVFPIEHDETGTVGVIINRPSHTPVGQILPDWQDVMSDPAVVFNGGPVQRDGALGLGRLAGATDAGNGLRAVSGGLALVDLDPGPPEPGTGLRASGGAVALVDRAAEPAEVAVGAQSLRVFAGHAGWGAGQ